MAFYDTDKLQNTQKSNLDLLQKVSAQVLEGAGELAKLQLSTLRSVTDEHFENVRKLLAVRDAEGFVDLQGSIGTPTAQLERLLDFNRQVYDVVSSTQAGIAKLFEQHVELGSKQVQDFVEEIAKNAPVGAEPVVAAFRSAVDGANTLYENTQKAAKQAAEIAENGINAASNAATQAAKAATTGAK
ncbi:phasin family protein [Azomonas agilis]|uniref:Phasin family protein n=1 Tax=Azomonas agilis TaxID=116849 RepID=A0A562HYP6_9GAMM|nr:TIGR01841 family phasin [Azomonas agilis]TWH63792.1 phasin family protein [Azomonas agilis]